MEQDSTRDTGSEEQHPLSAACDGSKKNPNLPTNKQPLLIYLFKLKLIQKWTMHKNMHQKILSGRRGGFVATLRTQKFLLCRPKTYRVATLNRQLVWMWDWLFVSVWSQTGNMSRKQPGNLSETAGMQSGTPSDQVGHLTYWEIV